MLKKPLALVALLVLAAAPALAAEETAFAQALATHLDRLEPRVAAELTRRAETESDPPALERHLGALERHLGALEARARRADEPVLAARIRTLRDALRRGLAPPLDAAPAKGAAGGIEGRVTDPDAAPAEGIGVELWSDDGFLVADAFTGAAGRYRFDNLTPGTYFVRTRSFGEFRDEVYDDIPCPDGCDPTTGTPIAVAGGEVTAGIDFELDRLGAIAGTVTDEATGEPVAFAFVEADNLAGTFAATNADENGVYVLGGLPAGTYFATVQDSSNVYLGELYDDLPCYGFCDSAAGTPIPVALNATTEGIDFTLDRAGTFSGTVSDETSGLPLAGATIAVQEPGGAFVDFASTDEAGRYTTPGLLPGVYVATAEDGMLAYLAELYDGIACPGSRGFECDLPLGTPIPIDVNTRLADVDFTLQLGGSLAGTVGDAQALAPIPFAAIGVFDAQGARRADGNTDAQGRYRVDGLLAGDYFVRTETFFQGYRNEVWDDVPCHESCDPTTGDPVAVTLGMLTPGIDFALDRLGGVAGRLMETATRAPIVDVEVQLWDANGDSVARETTGDDGRYRFGELLSGTYFVTTETFGRYRDELYDDLPCPGGGEFGCTPTDGTPIAVALNATVDDVDFRLDFRTGIRGRVTGDGQPLAGVRILVQEVDDFSQYLTTTGPSGRYEIGLPPGTYVVYTDNDLGAVDEVWDNVPCLEFCNPEAGTPINLDAADPIAEGIDFDLLLDGLCDPGPETLCLNRGRFEVEIGWQTPQGTSGRGQAGPLTDDSGYFWFFDPDNVELVVKVLDACGEPFDRFWVFAAGLTNVEVEITVTDTLTGDSKVYDNPLGTPFAPIQDTDAFATCMDVAGESAAASPDPHPLSELVDRLAALNGVELLTVGVGQDTCQTSPVRLCLQGGRFAVETDWTIPGGEIGRGDAVPLTADTGFFTFFDPDNVEVIVKVLDACDLAGFNSFWVFAAGLTNVGVDLTVIDTLSGDARVYRNPLGNPFQPLQDVRAFETCP